MKRRACVLRLLFHSMLVYVATTLVGFLAVVLFVIFGDNKRKYKLEDEPDNVPLNEEPWVPSIEVADWKEANAAYSMCPWNFEGCESIEDVLNCIWKKPVPKDLQVGFAALLQSVRHINVALVKCGAWKQTHFCIIYTLISGAELFGGAPSEQSVGLELEEEVVGLRRRGQATAMKVSEHEENPLPCIAAFFRIHDGFGTLMSRKHLPLLLETPGDTVHGSCFYVYPMRGLEQVHSRPSLLKVARVDRSCFVAVDRRKADPGVVYVERSTQCTEDDESPLSFIADTVSNIAGHRVVPAPYEGGPSMYHD